MGGFARQAATVEPGGIARRLMGPGAVRDLTASVVVFLVAMPLCMGIAVASGAPPEKGLVTGIIGGLIVGVLAGSPLQVSGPAAGLAVIVFEIVQEKGLGALGPILVLAGLVQFVAGVARLGGWFRAISPAVVHGMLAGIGVLIVVGQFHVLFDARPLANGLSNLSAMPERVLGLDVGSLGAAEAAFGIGLLTIATMLCWEKLRPASLRLLPGALLGVAVATAVAAAFALPVTRVAVPANIFAGISLPDVAYLGRIVEPSIFATAIAIAFIASAETLLSAAAVDKMHDGPRTDYNKELRAQGIGNLLCGFAGALPMTGVIVRSSANVQAGAVSRRSAMLHGVWMLGFVGLLPWLLREIPMAALGGVLVVTGWRLVSLTHVRHLFSQYGLLPALIWGATLVTVVTRDLLTGVLVGLALSLLEVVPWVRRIGLKVEHGGDASRTEIALDGTATFVTLAKLTTALDKVPTDRPLRLDVGRVDYVDHTVAEMLGDWVHRRRAAGGEVELAGNDDGRLKRLAA